VAVLKNLLGYQHGRGITNNFAPLVALNQLLKKEKPP
jgi:hypothetical protein